jgi:hypothetical protein
MLESRRCVSRSTCVTRALLWFAVPAAIFCPSCLAIPPNPEPYIDIVSPASVHPGVTGVTLTVFGANFVNTSIVKWKGIALTTTFVSSKKLTAAIPDSFVAAVGLGAITVVSPAPGGGLSNVGCSPSPATPGAPVTLTITVSSSAGTPTGSVTCLDGTTSLGSVTLSSGVATLSTSTLATGAHSITCRYAGSANFSASTSATLTETISGADFSFVSSAASSTVIPGKPTTISFTLTPQGGFTGQVQFSVSGIPPEATAVFTPAVLVLSGSGPATETLTITTPPSLIYNVGVHSSPFRSVLTSIFWMPFAGMVLGAPGLAHRRKGRIFLPLVLLAVTTFAIALGGCASSSSFQQSTPAGPYALTVTATSGTTSHATVVNVIVR